MDRSLASSLRLRVGVSLVLGLALVIGAFTALAEPEPGGFAPDPPGHASVKQWVFDVRVQRGRPIIERARAATIAQAAETARVMGRYAIELYVGPELLDRVRFNVPLAGDGAPTPSDRPKKNPFPRPRFDDISTRIRAQMADNPRGAHLALVDRATGSVERFEWPPEPDGTLKPIRGSQASADAGPAPSDGGGGLGEAGASDGGAKDGG